MGKPGTAAPGGKLKTRAPATSALAVLAVEQVAHRVSPGFVRLRQSLALVGVHAPLGYRISRVRFTTSRTTIRKPRLARLQLKLFRADGADFDRKCHLATYDNNFAPRCSCRTDTVVRLAPVQRQKPKDYRAARTISTSTVLVSAELLTARGNGMRAPRIPSCVFKRT
jgi:hypothetical protein